MFAPNGLTDSIAAGRAFRPTVNGAISNSSVSNVKTAASSSPSFSQLSTWTAVSRASIESRLHAAADVEQQADAHAGDVAPEVLDGPGNASLENLEVARLEVLNQTALLIADHCGDPNEVDARLEAGHRRRLRERRCGIQHQRGNGHTGQLPRHHRARYLQTCCHRGNTLINKGLLRLLGRRMYHENSRNRVNIALLSRFVVVEGM